ncbi:GRIP1-associated protein 1 [Gallus gallus]|uniref:GRIP1-associated protein 1 n=1 Tax=Gallus gallus TaxID=9031 RepID=UPI001F011943|nr:GRIP1-associated protein 1 [Gallus gallus]
MAQALSAEEFERMQAQLLELRTENYRLSDQLRRSSTELAGLRQKVQTLDKDLAKANKALSKSKKAQEVEALLGETRMLQGKLQSQEDDFRLQNSTLLRELAKLCAQIEGLEKENQRLRDGGGPGPPPTDPLGTSGPPQDRGDGDGGVLPAPMEAPQEPPKELQTAEEGGAGGEDTPNGDPPAPTTEEELSRLQAEVAELTNELRKKDESLQQLRAEKEALSNTRRAEAEQEIWELQEQKRQLREELEAAAQVEKGLREQSETLTRELQEVQSRRDALQAQLQERSQEQEELRQRLEAAENTQGDTEQRLRQAQELLELQAQEHMAATRAHREQHRAELEGRVGELRALLGDAERQRELQEAEGRALRQELKDVRDGQRILEKKGSAALKDLKRQLQLERRRADRLQERLQELLTPTRIRSGLEELGLESGSPGRGPGGDSSSVSSLGRESSAPGSTKSGSGSPGGGSGGGVPAGGGLSPAEVAELFQRLAQSQQERWLLEEKVRHLEVSSASMAEDLCRKSAIIESFVRDSRLEAAGPPVAPRRGAGPGEEGLREMNKKLQNLLEEQLTKNLHMSQDLEMLSQELARLRNEGAPP